MFCALWFLLWTSLEPVRVYIGRIHTHTPAVLSALFSLVIVWFMFWCVVKETIGSKKKREARVQERMESIGINWVCTECLYGLYGFEHPLCISIYNINYTKTTKVERILFNSDFGFPFIITSWSIPRFFSVNSICQASPDTDSLIIESVGVGSGELKIPKSLLCPEFIYILLNWNTIFVFVRFFSRF